MNQMRSCTLIFFILCLLVAPVAAQNPPQAADPAKMAEYLNRLAKLGFTGGVLIARDGQVLLEQGYGLADRKRNLPFTKDTVFDIGSNTKDFTKLAILQLAEQNKLRLQATLAEFFNNVPPDKVVITVEQLMNHTSGFGMYEGRDEEKVTKEEFLRRVFAARLVSEPGKKNNYSNPGYSMLAAIIEKVSGKTYEQYVYDHILKPAGMMTTGYVIPKWRDGQVTRNYEDGEERPSTFDYPHLADGPSWSLRGNGGTLSTLGDMYKFNLALEGEKLLAKEFKAKLFDMNSPITLVGGNGVHYFVYHRDPANHLVMLIATTDADWRAIEINRPLMMMAKGQNVVLPPQAINIDSTALAKLAGAYSLPSGAQFNVSVKGERLFISGANESAMALLSGAARGNPEQVSRINAQVKAMLEAGGRGDHQLMYQAFGAAMPYDEFKARQEGRWQARNQKYGAFKGVGLLATAPGPGGYLTTARLDFERGNEYAQFIWGGVGMLRGVRFMDAAPGYVFYPQSASEFFRFNLTDGEALRISFKRQGEAGGFSLSIEPTERSVAANPPAQQKVDGGNLPDTPAGRVARAYFTAFNSGDEKQVEEFFLKHISRAALANRAMSERLGFYRQMRDDMGTVTITAVESDGQRITVQVQAKNGGSAEFRFEMDGADPEKLKAIGVERS
jgi:CubicO group peptidase (beta-lactamase class C family)